MSPIKLGSSGLEKFGWLKRLKNSALRCNEACSPNAVFLNREKLNSLKLGPRNEFRPSLPKWRVPGTQLNSVLSSGSFFDAHWQGAANADKSRNCAGLLE